MERLALWNKSVYFLGTQKPTIILETLRLYQIPETNLLQDCITSRAHTSTNGPLETAVTDLSTR